jgi:tRNA pseudouridine55 synthase
MQGLLLVDKPKGWTSFDVVNRVRRIVAQAEGVKPKSVKVGHTGTLDPLATGLLVLLVGKNYTRRAPELSGLDKVYDVTAYLGKTSSTGDEEGQKQIGGQRVPGLDEINQTLQQLSGHLMQTPPAFSAIKVAGQRAYQLARTGQAVELEARPVIIHSNTLESYQYPLIKFTSQVSSGTYIRSLVDDIGHKLGVGAYMSDLCRLSVGWFFLKQALTVQNLSADSIAGHLQLLG